MAFRLARNGQTEDALAHKIKNAFAPDRGRFMWIPCPCKLKEELECGPRTILAMWKIQQGIYDNLSIVDCIRRATLIGEPPNLYISTKIREKIAQFVNRLTSSMVTPPIRFRQRTSLYRAPLNNEASRNPIVL